MSLFSFACFWNLDFIFEVATVTSHFTFILTRYLFFCGSNCIKCSWLVRVKLEHLVAMISRAGWKSQNGEIKLLPLLGMHEWQLPSWLFDHAMWISLLFYASFIFPQVSHSPILSNLLTTSKVTSHKLRITCYSTFFHWPTIFTLQIIKLKAPLLSLHFDHNGEIILQPGNQLEKNEECVISIYK